MTQLTLNGIWNGAGYRDLTLVMIDPKTRKEYEVRLPPKDVERLIHACADAVKQIGLHPPLDWESYPTVIYWPSVTTWMAPPVDLRPGEKMILATRETFEKASSTAR